MDNFAGGGGASTGIEWALGRHVDEANNHDIGMRMLTARELFRAQGFMDSYVIDRAWIVDPKTGQTVETKLTKEQQIRMCGNSVCPTIACALVAANSADMAIWRRSERASFDRYLAQILRDIDTAKLNNVMGWKLKEQTA